MGKGKFNKFSWKLQLKGLRKISFEIKSNVRQRNDSSLQSWNQGNNAIEKESKLDQMRNSKTMNGIKNGGKQRGKPKRN
jgi:hypothetical protein